MRDGEPEARLLVVEDEPNILELLSASLRLAGFEVATATGGLEALTAAQRHRPDLVVLDVMLPDLDGFDVARRLRTGDTRTPVLFLTARDATEDKVAGLTVAALVLLAAGLWLTWGAASPQRTGSALGPRRGA